MEEFDEDYWHDELSAAKARAAKRAKAVKDVKNASSGSAGAHKEQGASGPAPAPAPRVRPESATAGVVAVEDTDALDCGVCYLPLKPPIFQCHVGHVVCSSCCDKLIANGKCHVCGIATSGYRRCHAMERMVESVRVPCPNAAHGCTARPTYYGQQGHRLMCPYMPCCCPGKDCGFVGSLGALLDHFTAVHGWPCNTKIRVGDSMCSILLHNGFNFFIADCGQDATATTSSQYLFLLNVTRQPLGRTISMRCIFPCTTSEDQGSSSTLLTCALKYTGRSDDLQTPFEVMVRRRLESDFILKLADLSNRVPNHDELKQFVVLNSELGDDDANNDTIQVQTCVFIHRVGLR
ncbi:hypothetical protein ACP70R_041291 [Stipagrostis hirtigluma subsp. patula]